MFATSDNKITLLSPRDHVDRGRNANGTWQLASHRTAVLAPQYRPDGELHAGSWGRVSVRVKVRTVRRSGAQCDNYMKDPGPYDQTMNARFCAWQRSRDLAPTGCTHVVAQC